MNGAQSQTSLHRTPSRAASRASTSLSKSQSLIKKNIELQDLKPADILIERFIAWKAIVKQLTAYFEGIADIENNTAKEMVKLAGLIQVPFRSGNQFLGEGGLQDVYYGIRDKTRNIADQHANLGRTIDSSIVEHLKKLGLEIKAHIKNVQNDTGKLAASVAKEREVSTRLVGELANAVSMYKNTPMSIPARSDPFLANQSVALQLHRQVLEENLLQKSIIIMQQNSAHFEAGIVRSLQSAWATYSEWLARSTHATLDIHAGLAEHMASLTPEGEWVAFAGRSDHLVDPETPLRDPEYIVYPLKDDPAVRALHTGHLERKAGGMMGRNWREGYYVLTPAGFLHEFASGSDGERGGGHGKEGVGRQPVFSLFLPNCTLGPASGAGAGQHKFHVEGRRDGMGDGGRGGGGLGSGGGGGSRFKAFLKGDLAGGSGGGTGMTSSEVSTSGSAKAWTFRARSHEDMMEWWNDMRMLCARYLVASESVRRSGPVEAAVRAVGYASDGEEEWDEEGSSVELEEGEEGEGETGAPPGYSGRYGGYGAGAEVGANGYPIDKKAPQQAGGGDGYGYAYGAGAEGHAPPPVGAGTGHHGHHHHHHDHPEGHEHHEHEHGPEHHHDDDGHGEYDAGGGGGGGRGVGVERKGSRRALEKAPEAGGGGEAGVKAGC